MTTGVGLARARSSRQTSNPFLRGSVMSRMTRSGAVEMALASPSSPSAAVTTSYPSSSRLSRRPSNICGSSSITRMRFVTVALSCMEREVERERAADARHAVDAHEGVVAPHYVVDDRETQPGPMRSRARIGLNPKEFVEDLPLQTCRNSDPAVVHADDAVLIDLVDFDQDLAVFGRILHRVREQVFQRLFGGFLVDQDRHVGRQLRRHHELIVLELALERLAHAASEVGQVHALELVGAKSSLDLREVEQVVDEACQLPRFAVDDAVVLVGAVGVLQPSELQRFRE